MSNKRVYLAVIIISTIYAGMHVFSKIAFNEGMSTYIFVFYRQAFATLLLAPIALLLERITGSLSPYNIALDYTSPTLTSALVNMIPVVTFVLAVLLRVETVKLKRLSGIAKIFGVALCVAGIATIAFYGGPYIKSPIRHHDHDHGLIHAKSRKTWALGTFILIMSYTLWSLWITFQIFFSTIQSFFVALAVERDLSKWKLGFNMSLFSAAYGGIVVTRISYYLQSWCIKKRGPVFSAMSTALTVVITIAISSFILGEMIICVL